MKVAMAGHEEPRSLIDSDIFHENSSDTTLYRFEIGDQVDVASRTTPGINKPGGAARIRAINLDGTYSVTYILGGKEDHIDIKYITRRDDYEGRPQRKRNIPPSSISPPIIDTNKDLLIDKPKKVPKVSSKLPASLNRVPPPASSSSTQTAKLTSSVPSPLLSEHIDDESASLESINSPKSIHQIKAYSDITKQIINELLSLLKNKNFHLTDDGGYLVHDLEQYYSNKFDKNITNEFEEALAYYEAENIVMMISDDENNRVLFII